MVQLCRAGIILPFRASPWHTAGCPKKPDLLSADGQCLYPGLLPVLVVDGPAGLDLHYCIVGRLFAAGGNYSYASAYRSIPQSMGSSLTTTGKNTLELILNSLCHQTDLAGSVGLARIGPSGIWLQAGDHRLYSPGGPWIYQLFHGGFFGQGET